MIHPHRSNPVARWTTLAAAVALSAVTAIGQAPHSTNLIRGDTSFETGSPGGRYRVGTLAADGAWTWPVLSMAWTYDGKASMHGNGSLRLPQADEAASPAVRFELPGDGPAARMAAAYARATQPGGTASIRLVDRDGEVLSEASVELESYWRRIAATVADAGDESAPGRRAAAVLIVIRGTAGPAWVDAVQAGPTDDDAIAYRQAAPLTFGVRIPAASPPPAATAPVRLTAHVYNDTEYIAVCRVVGRLTPVGEPDAEAVVAEARLGLLPESGEDAVLEFADAPAGRYRVVVNRADGPPEEEASIELEVGAGPPLEVVALRLPDEPGAQSVRITAINRGDAPLPCAANVWLEDRPIALEPQRSTVDPGAEFTAAFPLPVGGAGSGGDTIRARLETPEGAVELEIPAAPAGNTPDDAPDPAADPGSEPDEG